MAVTRINSEGREDDATWEVILDLALMRGRGSVSELQYSATLFEPTHHNLIIFVRGRDPGPDHRASPHEPGSAGQVIDDE